MDSHNSKAFKRLDSIAKNKLKNKLKGNGLFEETQKYKQIDFNEYFLPETFSLGYGSDVYSRLNDEQKIFLNHISYFIHYFRTTGAELIAVYNNLALTKNLENTNIANYLYLEAEEEKDHIKAFQLVMSSIVQHYQLDDSVIKNKILNKLSCNTLLNNILIKLFGPKYVTTYFLARGVFNHIGYCYESNILNTVKEDNLIYDLTKLHIIDEKRHTAISHSFSSAINEVMIESSNNNVFDKIACMIENQVINTSFSEKYNTIIEANILKSFIAQSILFTLEQRNILILLADNFYTQKNNNISLCTSLDSNVYQLIDQSQLDSQRKTYWKHKLNSFGLIA